MSDPFVHLRVASGYSLQYGASHPADLVERAAEFEMDTMALTDRDGLYGAIRFAKACLSTGVAPVLGVDLAVLPEQLVSRPQRRVAAPAHGGPLKDLRLPRAVVLANSKAGWAKLCRLVSATHLRGERGAPICSAELIAEHGADGDLLVLLGADSELGMAAARGDIESAERLLDAWRTRIGEDQLIVAVTHQQVRGTGIGSLTQASRLLHLADRHRLTAVITNAVRMLDSTQAPTLDVLDAARRLVPLGQRNVDRRNAEGHFKSGKQMFELAQQVAQRAGRGAGGGERLLAQTRQVALRCRLDPRADLGLGEIHLPELKMLNGSSPGVGDGGAATQAMAVLRRRCEAGINDRYATGASTVGVGFGRRLVWQRLEEELQTVSQLGFAPYFLTVADVVSMINKMGIRCAARGSGAGSLINYLLGISGVDPLRHGLIMERFLSPLRQALPDIDLDVEAARRTDIYDAILDTFGGERVACVAMLGTYRVRHAVRDVGAALSLPPGEIDAIAKAFPHIRAKDARAALRDLPELRLAGLAERRLDVLFNLVESLDGLPRQVALHPCGVLLSDATLLDRTPIEASHDGYPMSQFDKDDVEDIGLLKLDVLGIRMQSAMAHAITEIERTEHKRVDIDAIAPFDDPQTYALIGNAATLGCFQIESPGQRELVAKFGPANFNDIIIDISLFRPGPVKSDMIVPFLQARQGWRVARYWHPDLEPVLAETGGVVVFHEQVIKIISILAGCSLAEGDETRRALGDRESQPRVRSWFCARAAERGYSEAVIAKAWEVLAAFASFGFCKAHAAAFALPTYQSAWLKTHYPAHFLSGVLSHDPGMYPKRLVVEEARRLGITILGLDVNASDELFRVERVEVERVEVERVEVERVEVERVEVDKEQDESSETRWAQGRVAKPGSRLTPGAGLPDGRDFGIRLSLADVMGINETEIARIVAGRPFRSLSDFWFRTRVSQPVVERLVLAGGFDSVYGISPAGPGSDPAAARNRVTRRDLLLAVADLHRTDRVDSRLRGRRALSKSVSPVASGQLGTKLDPAEASRRQSMGTAGALAQEIQLPLDWRDPLELPDQHESDEPNDIAEGEPGVDEDETRERYALKAERDGLDITPSGLLEFSPAERVRAELSVLGVDASRHVVAFYRRFLDAIGITYSADLLQARTGRELLVAGVKVATQTPPVRSGRRVVFLTLDDATGPADATFFEDAQGPYAATVFSSWLLVVRGVLRRTGPRGVSLRATGAWELQQLYQTWQATLDETGEESRAVERIQELLAEAPAGFQPDDHTKEPAPATFGGSGTAQDKTAQDKTRAGGMGQRRVLVHASGFKQSPYADVGPAGSPSNQPPRKLWHSSPGSSGP